MHTDIQVRVTPNARINQIKTEQQDDGSTVLRVFVTAAPDDGKANEAVIKLLAKHMDVAKSRLHLVRGMTSRNKVFRVTD